MQEIDHEYTKEIVCPYCGFKFEDSWEVSGDDGDITCDDCGKEFSFERIKDITYTTYAKENNNEPARE